MMASIKKLLLTITLVWVSFISFSQQIFYFNNSNFGIWQQSGQACAGCGNVWMTVTHSNIKNMYGYYEYYIWSSTNSYTNDGATCYTYLSDVSVMYKTYSDRTWFYPTNFYKFWIIVGQKQVIYTLYYPNLYAEVYVGIGTMQPYY